MSDQPAAVETPAAPVAPAEPVAEAPAVVEFNTAPPTTVIGAEPPAAAAPAEAPAEAPAAAPAPAPQETESGAAPDPAASASPPEAPAEGAAPEPLSYEPFRFAEGLVVASDDPGLTKFTELATGLRLPQDKAQELVDLYGEQATKYAADLEQKLVQRQFDTFADTVKGWEKQFRDDPEFKNRVNTVVEDAKWAIAELGGTAEQQQELRDLLTASGTGSHRAMIRTLANAAKRLKEARPGPRPAPATSRAADPAERRYGAMRSN